MSSMSFLVVWKIRVSPSFVQCFNALTNNYQLPDFSLPLCSQSGEDYIFYNCNNFSFKQTHNMNLVGDHLDIHHHHGCSENDEKSPVKWQSAEAFCKETKRVAGLMKTFIKNYIWHD